MLAASGERVDGGSPRRTDGDRVVHLPLRPGLADGTYVVLWRVLSADSHPVSGSFAFSLGAPTPGSGHEGGGTASPRGPGLLLGLSRGLGFAGLLVLLGGAVLCLLLWPAGGRTGSVRRLLGLALVVELVTAVAGVLLQGPYAAGLGVSRALDADLVTAVLDTRYGQAGAARAGLAAGALLLLPHLLRLPGRAGPAVLAGAGTAVAGTWTLAGHGAAGDLQPWAGALDVVHLVAASTWVGGLVLLGLVLRGGWDDELAARLLPAWSRVAAGAVLVLVATGVLAGWRETRSLAALTGTSYGGLLALKALVVAVMLVLGAGARRHVRALRAGPEPLAGLRRSVRVETGAAALVVGVTAVLVQTPPAAGAYAPPYSGTSYAGPVAVQVDVHPARRGLNRVHLSTLRGARTVDVSEISARLVGTDGEVIDVAAERRGLGHYEDLDVLVPVTGTWRVEVRVRLGETDSHATRQLVRVR